MTTDRVPTVVLVHGMWHGGWAWERVAALLEAQGHPCVRVTLPGTDRAPGDPTFRGHCDHLVRVLAGVPGDVVLVGHSYSGALLTEVGAAPNVRAAVVTRAAWREVPSHFVVCTLDRACTPDVQRMMAARLGSSSELESSHSPMLSMPDAVAREIVEFASRHRASVGAS